MVGQQLQWNRRDDWLQEVGRRRDLQHVVRERRHFVVTFFDDGDHRPAAGLDLFDVGDDFVVDAAARHDEDARRVFIDERDRPITSLSAQASTIEASLSGRKAWPGPGPTNPRVDQMTQTLLNAAALVRRYGAEVAHEQTEAHRDLEARKTTGSTVLLP